MWRLSKNEVFSICLVAIVLKLFTAALLLTNKGWILQYYLSARDSISCGQRRRMAEFLPEKWETWITQRNMVLVHDCASAHSVSVSQHMSYWKVCLGSGSVEPLRTRRRWCLFCLRWQKIVAELCKHELQVIRMRCQSLGRIWFTDIPRCEEKQKTPLANHTFKPFNTTSQSRTRNVTLSGKAIIFFCGVISISVLVAYFFYPFLLNKNRDFKGKEHICALVCSETCFNWLANKKCFIWLFSTAKLPSNARAALRCPCCCSQGSVVTALVFLLLKTFVFSVPAYKICK